MNAQVYLVAPLDEQSRITDNLLCGMEIMHVIPSERSDIQNPHGPHAYVIQGDAALQKHDAYFLLEHLQQHTTASRIEIHTEKWGIFWPFPS